MIILCSCFSKSSFFFFICAVLSVDAIDMSGKHEVDLDTSIWKVRKFLSFFSFRFFFFFAGNFCLCYKAVRSILESL